MCFTNKFAYLIGTLEQREKLHRENLRAKKAIWDEEQRKIASKRTRGLLRVHPKLAFVLILNIFFSEQLLALAKEINLPIPDDFDKLYPPEV